MIQNQQNGKKPHFRHDLGPLDPNSNRDFFSPKNLASSVTRYHGQLSSCTISDPILRKLSDGQMDSWTDRQNYAQE